MPVQDLTPQLRTRLSRLEKLVGVFVTLATLLLLGGMAYYLHHTARRKGWFDPKAPYYVYLRSGAGIKVGDTVKLLGFDAGEITRIKPEKPYTYDEKGRMVDVYVEFNVRGENIGFVWSDSMVKVKSAGLLGARFLEITKGGSSGATSNVHATFRQNAAGQITHMLADEKTGAYVPFRKDKPYWLQVDEPPELTAQMDEIIRTVKGVLPTVLELTNQLAVVFSNASAITVHLDELLVGARPILTNMNEAMTNLNVITANLRTSRGALGELLLPTNLQNELVLLLPNVNSTVTNLNTNLVAVLSNLNVNLEQLAGITSNLHAQVQANTNILSNISTAIVHTDDLIQGLKRHWLLRSAFKPKPADTKTNAPSKVIPARSPRGESMR